MRLQSEWDNIVSDSDYPRSANSDELEAIPEPVELFPSAVINHFIDTMEMDEEILDAELESPATVINDLDIPGWEEEVIEDPQISEGLLARSKANLFTQRNQVMQNGWQEPQQQPVYNQVHRATPTGMPSYGMLNQNGQTHSFNQQTQPQPTPLPNEFLPSFVDYADTCRTQRRTCSHLRTHHSNLLKSKRKSHLLSHPQGEMSLLKQRLSLRRLKVRGSAIQR